MIRTKLNAAAAVLVAVSIVGARGGALARKAPIPNEQEKKAPAAWESRWESRWKVPRLNDDTYARWLEFIRPDARESLYKRYHWRTNFGEAIREARELQRPVLFWAMNGHPLGEPGTDCT